jgi:hypothetical protein
MNVSDYSPQTAPTVVTAPPPEVLREMAAYAARAQMANSVSISFTRRATLDAPSIDAGVPPAPLPRRPRQGRRSARPRRRQPKLPERKAAVLTREALRAAEAILWIEALLFPVGGICFAFAGVSSHDLGLAVAIPCVGLGAIYAGLARRVRKRRKLRPEMPLRSKRL